MKTHPSGWRRLIFCAGLIAVCTCGAAAAVSGSLRGLKITGAAAVPAGDVRQVMATAAPGPFDWLPFRQYPRYDAKILAEDIKSIRQLYQAEGYYHTQITPAVRQDAQGRSWITITIHEGRPTMIASVTLRREDTETAISDERLFSQLHISTGQVFRTELYTAAKTRAVAFLADNGYPDATITGTAVVDRTSWSAALTFTVAAGPRRSFGQVTISGNKGIAARYITRELAFSQGEVFSQSKINQSQRLIFRTGLFNSVMLNPEFSDAPEVPVSIDVVESQRRALEIGVGYGSEDRVRARIAWTRKYFLGEPRTLSLAARYSSILFSGTASLLQPYFLAKENSLNLSSGYNREFYVSYHNEKIYIQPRVTRALGGPYEAFVAYNLEVNRPLSVDTTLVRELMDTYPGEYYFISSMIAGIKRDTVGGNLSPKNGSLLSVYVEPASFLIASKVDYIRAFGEYRLFTEVAREWVLAARAQAGGIEPLRTSKDVPLFKRFFTGGSSTVRGYSFQSLGPQDADGNPVGGRYLLEGNLELRYPLYKKLRGVAFADAGNTYLTWADVTSTWFAYAAGVGFRYETVIGPVRLDIAFPFQRLPEIDARKYAFYISLGNTF